MIEKKVAEITHELKKLMAQENWQKSTKNVSAFRENLNQLTTFKATEKLLRETEVARTVKKLTKHEDSTINGFSNSLVKKWKKDIGFTEEPKKTAKKRSKSVPNYPSVVSPRKTDSNSHRKYNASVDKLRSNYANLKEKKMSRSIQVIHNAPVKKGWTKSSTISLKTRPFNSRIPIRGSAATGAVGRKSTLVNNKPVVNSTSPVKELERRHELRKQKLLQRANIASRQNAIPSKIQARSSASSGTKSMPLKSRSSGVVNDVTKSANSSRREMLDRLYPRINGASSIEEKPRKKASTSSAKKSGTSIVPKPRNKGELEVVKWLKGLMADMSEYADTFIDNGFDSLPLLKKIELDDLPSLVSKTGHQRVIREGLLKLTGKPIARSDRHPQRRKSRKSRSVSDNEYESDGFIVNDDKDDIGYVHGVISNMFQKNRRKRQFDYASDGSSDMEASFEEMQQEEERSAMIGQKEDYLEDKKLRQLAKKKRLRKNGHH